MKAAILNVDKLLPVGEDIITIPKGSVIAISDYTTLSGKYTFFWNGNSGIIKKEKIDIIE